MIKILLTAVVMFSSLHFAKAEVVLVPEDGQARRVIGVGYGYNYRLKTVVFAMVAEGREGCIITDKKARALGYTPKQLAKLLSPSNVTWDGNKMVNSGSYILVCHQGDGVKEAISLTVEAN